MARSFSSSASDKNTFKPTSTDMATMNSKQQKQKQSQGFLDVIFSWSLSDVLNKNLYKFKVEEVPLTFSSTSHYINSFTYLLLEETRADILSHISGISQAPVTPVSGLRRIPTATANDKQLMFFYHLKLQYASKRDYAIGVGDLIVLTEVRPESIADLTLTNGVFCTAYVTGLVDKSRTDLMILSSHDLEYESRSKGGFAVCLTNLTTNMRIWQALSSAANLNLIQTTFSFNSSTASDCEKCCNDGEKMVTDLKIRQAFNSFELDTSQKAAVFSCLAAKKCCHESSSIKLIWGPPGTGKTKTVASLLFVLLRMNHRTLICAPTNVAVVGVAKRLLSLLGDHGLGIDTFRLGDIVLFGNKERMKIENDHEELFDVFLDNRVKVLGNSLWVWKTCPSEMIRLLENPIKEYQCYLAPTVLKIKSKNKKKENEENLDQNHEVNQLTFEEFVMNRFSVLGQKLITCIKNLCTHLPSCVISLSFAKKMKLAIDLIQKVEAYLKEMVNRNQSFKKAFETSVNHSQFMKLRSCITECLQTLNDLRSASLIPRSMRKFKVKSFCLSNACLIFCTASSSIKLSKRGMTPIKMVLIDEAAQLKECESVIPLHLPGVQKAVLVDDERQLPSMVQSKICEDAMFGRSLFERLVLLGHYKHLLSVQYRMHPSISQFPNAEFYNRQIFDAPNVTDKAREKCFLEEDMYGSYSFINVGSANEELDKNNSTRNMVEVDIIAQIVAKLFKESVSKKQTVTVGCISPYKAQVDALQTILGSKYNREGNSWRFCVNVRSVDGFQGSEEDVIIFSTVRCNSRGSVGFLSSRERANVALTRARHCLWIVGNKETMVKSGSVWSTLVHDAENRGCVFDAHEDKTLAQVMVNAMIELADFVPLFKTDSVLFKGSKWKVIFGKTFLESTANIRNHNVCKQVVSLLVKLSNGWRHVKETKRNRYSDRRGTCDMLEVYDVNGHLQLVWSVEIVYEKSQCVQVLKFWDLVRLPQIELLVSRLESGFGSYTIDKVLRCQTKCIERNVVLPMTWPADIADDDPGLVLSRELGNLSLESPGGGACG